MSTPGQPPQQPPWEPAGSSGYPPPGQWSGPPPDHPRATTVLVLGILGLVLCGLLAPVAWVMGNGVVREIDAAPGRYGGRGQANAGRICGIIGTALIILALLLFAALLIGSVATVSTST